MNVISLSYLAWIAIIVVLAWALPQRWQPKSVAVLTFLFLVYYAPLSLGLLTLTSLFVYGCVRKSKSNFVSLALSLTLLLSLWISSKIISGGTEVSGPGLAMPLGLSYYTFRQIHYILESKKGTLEEHGIFDYLCYLFFLPSFFVGPIHRFPEFLRDLRRRRWDSALFSLGLERILYGYVKIVFLANYLLSNRLGFWTSGLWDSSPFWKTYFDCIQYWANLYFQFSGYCDIAVGFSLLLGFRIIENFDYPFLAPNIIAFWQRWHLSLTLWCKEYVYTPVAAYTRNGLAGILVAMTVLGLWHEFSLRYILWGVYHAIAIALCSQFQKITRNFPSWRCFENPVWKGGIYIFFLLLTFNFIISSHFVIHWILGFLSSKTS